MHLHAAAEVGGREVEADAERLQHISPTAFAGDGAVPVLHHARAAGGEEKHDGRGDIEEFQLVPARAADIQHRPRQPRGVQPRSDGPPEQRLRKGCELRRGLAFRAECFEKVPLRAVGHFRRDELRHGCVHYFPREIEAREELRGEVGEHGVLLACLICYRLKPLIDTNGHL